MFGRRKSGVEAREVAEAKGFETVADDKSRSDLWEIGDTTLMG